MNDEAKNAAKKVYRAANREKIAAYRAASREKIAARDAAYRAANRAQGNSYKFIAALKNFEAVATATKTAKQSTP
jgi:hypothetical protein